MWKNTGMILVLFLCAIENQYNAGERRQNINGQTVVWVGDPGQIHFLSWGCWAAVSLYLWCGPAAFPLTSSETPDSRWGNHGDVVLP